MSIYSLDYAAALGERAANSASIAASSAWRLWFAGLILVFASSATQAQVSDVDALHRMAQAEKDGGRVSAFRVVEPYRAIAAVVFQSNERAGRESQAAARAWATDFCARASRDFQWERRWRLTVYVNHASGAAYSCSISSEGIKIGDGRGTPGDPCACEGAEDSPYGSMKAFD